MNFHKLICVLAPILLVGCLEDKEIRPATSARSVTDLTNPHFALAVQQGGKKIPIRDHTVVLRRAPFDVLIALPAPGGVFVNASRKPDLARHAAQNPRIDDRMPLEAYSEEPSRILTLAPKGFAYWYYMAPGISKFTDVRIVGHPSMGRTWVCKKSLGAFRDSNSSPRKMSQIDADSIYLVFVKGQWRDQRRVAQAHEWLRVVFR
jgi:hypothetical protein